MPTNWFGPPDDWMSLCSLESHLECISTDSRQHQALWAEHRVGVKRLPVLQAWGVDWTDPSMTCAGQEENPQVCSAVGNVSLLLSLYPTLLCADGRGICPKACIRRQSDRSTCLNPSGGWDGKEDTGGTDTQPSEHYTSGASSTVLQGPTLLELTIVSAGSSSKHRLQ